MPDGVQQQILSTVLDIQGKMGKIEQCTEDLDKYIKSVDLRQNALEQRQNGKADRTDINAIHKRINEVQGNCPAIGMHVAVAHNPDAELGKKMRKTGSFLSRLIFWRR